MITINKDFFFTVHSHFTAHLMIQTAVSSSCPHIQFSVATVSGSATTVVCQYELTAEKGALNTVPLIKIIRGAYKEHAKKTTHLNNLNCSKQQSVTALPQYV